jgi:hypothetical protein
MKIRLDSTKEHLESKGGLLLAGQLAGYMGISGITSDLKRNAGEIITELIGMLVQGETDYQAINCFRHNVFFKESLGLSTVYSADTVRLYLDALAKDAPFIMEQLQACSNRLLKKADMGTIKVGRRDYIPVDIDTTAMDNSGTKKEKIGYTYRGFVGYHPLFAYIGREGYMLSGELRPGSQHCQNGTPEFIKRINADLDGIVPGKNVLFRLDAGNDSLETIRALFERKNRFLIIKRNIRQESPEWWLEQAKTHGKQEVLRKGKIRYTGTMNIDTAVTQVFPQIRVVFEVIERTIDRNGAVELFPKIEVNTWWTNLKIRAEAAIELYHAHGTSEQFHSELKTDLGLERFPSGKYAVNQIVLSAAMAAFNILRFIGQSALEQACYSPYQSKSSRKRIGKVIRDLIQIACKIVKHAGELIVRVCEDHPWFLMFHRLKTIFQTL